MIDCAGKLLKLFLAKTPFARRRVVAVGRGSPKRGRGETENRQSRRRKLESAIAECLWYIKDGNTETTGWSCCEARRYKRGQDIWGDSVHDVPRQLIVVKNTVNPKIS
jgi:hypothetical protein